MSKLQSPSQNQSPLFPRKWSRASTTTMEARTKRYSRDRE
jgi:hypothetical protein